MSNHERVFEAPANLRRNRYLLAAVNAAQLADMVTFLPAVRRVGIQAEENPIVREAFSVLGAAGPIALKAFSVAMVVLLLSRVMVRFPRHALLPTAIAVTFGLLGAWSNIVFGLTV